MSDSDTLCVRYREHDRVGSLIHRLRDYLEEISLGFDRWEEPRIYGPGMYLAIVVGPSVASYADPMGANRWPKDADCDAFGDDVAFLRGAIEVAYEFDGAVVVSVDGIASRQMVRFRMTDISPDLGYASWMGARHMSALDISTRDDVVATLTLSEETGRVTIFEDGSYESIEREQIGAPWRG